MPASPAKTWLDFQEVFLTKSFRCQLDQAANQVGIANSAFTPQAWIHADIRESWHGTNLINQDRTIFSQEEINPRKTFETKDFEDLDRQVSNGVAHVR